MYADKLILHNSLSGRGWGGVGGGGGRVQQTDGQTSNLHMTPPGGRDEWERGDKICNSHFRSRERA